MSLPYFNLYTRDFRDGVRGLKAEEVGVYILVLTLIYDNDGAIDDDEADIAHKIGFDVRVWRRVRSRLIACGKLKLKDQRLSNKKADGVIADRTDFSERQARAGKAGGKASGKARRGAKSTPKTTPDRDTSGEDLRNFFETSSKLLQEVPEKSEQKANKNMLSSEAKPSSLSYSSSATASAAAEPRARTRSAALRTLSTAPIIDAEIATEPTAPDLVDVGFDVEMRAGKPTPVVDEPPLRFGTPEPCSPRQRDRKRMLEACYAVAGPGLADPCKHPTLDLSGAFIDAALKAGCDFDADILPVIAAKTAQPRASPILSFGYFAAAWSQHFKTRTTALALPEGSTDVVVQHPAVSATRNHPSAQRSARRHAALEVLGELGCLAPVARRSAAE